jgi:hypothetical protein
MLPHKKRLLDEGLTVEVDLNPVYPVCGERTIPDAEGQTIDPQGVVAESNSTGPRAKDDLARIGLHNVDS